MIGVLPITISVDSNNNSQDNKIDYMLVEIQGTINHTIEGNFLGLKLGRLEKKDVSLFIDTQMY